jgi:IS66 Orf2 like protein
VLRHSVVHPPVPLLKLDEILRQMPQSAAFWLLYCGRCLHILHFRSRSGTTVRLLTFDGQGYWLLIKRLSQGRFRWWPNAEAGVACALEAWQAQLLLAAGDVSGVWRRQYGGRWAHNGGSKLHNLIRHQEGTGKSLCVEQTRLS